jgi:hypothetical protein
MFAWVLILVAWVLFLSLILHDVTKDEATGSAVSIAARKLRALIALAVIRFRKFRRARAKAIARARAEKRAATEAAAAAAAASTAAAALAAPPSPVPAEPVAAEPSTVSTPAEQAPAEPAPAEQSSVEPAFAEQMPVETASPEIAPSTPIPSDTSQSEESETPQHIAPEAIRLVPETAKQVPTSEAPAPKKKWWRSQNERAAKTIPEIETAITEAVKSTAPDCGGFVGVIVRQKTPKSRQDVNWELQGVKFGKADKKRANDALHGIVKQMQREFRLSDQ